MQASPSSPAHSGRIFSITLVATLGGLLFGYDTAVISGAIGNLKIFFGLSDAQQGWAASSALVGCILGALMASEASRRLGRRSSMQVAAWLFLISALGTALPWDFTSFIFFRIVGGVGVGMASMVSPMYIAEMAPAERRGQLVSYNQFAIVVGILLVYFVNYFIARQGDATWNMHTGWRWMFGSEALPAILFAVLLWRVPRSPRWLMLRGQEAEARQVLARLYPATEIERLVAEIRASLHTHQPSWRDLGEKGIPRLLWIGILLSVFQQVTGINVFMYYAPEIFKGFGSGTDTALLQTVLVGSVNMLFTILAIYTVDKWGRKPLQIVGAVGMAVCMGAIGTAAYYQAIGGWLLVFVLGYIASFALSWGPVVWVLLAEIFPNRVRSLAMSLAVAAQWIANFVVSQTFPMLNGNAYLQKNFHGAFPFWLYGSMAGLALIFVWRYVPETKGQSLEELEKKLGATA
ncbi:MAG: sugar porter family MFS transporter [Microscillaceae bacterium]|nr:sugar porter family MFS transporter [Microscillaceae bacterium]